MSANRVTIATYRCSFSSHSCFYLLLIIIIFSQSPSPYTFVTVFLLWHRLKTKNWWFLFVLYQQQAVSDGSDIEIMFVQTGIVITCRYTWCMDHCFSPITSSYTVLVRYICDSDLFLFPQFPVHMLHRDSLSSIHAFDGEYYKSLSSFIFNLTLVHLSTSKTLLLYYRSNVQSFPFILLLLFTFLIKLKRYIYMRDVIANISLIFQYINYETHTWQRMC